MKFKVWLGLGTLTILLALATALILMFVRSQAASPPTQNLPQVGGTQTARQAYQVLQQWMPGWASDAQLISVSASLLKTEAQGFGWSFQVYSPARQQLAVVLVTPDKVWVLREKSLPYAQRLIVQSDWKFDSDGLLSQCGSRLAPRSGRAAGSGKSLIPLRSERNGVWSGRISLLDVEGELVGIGVSAPPMVRCCMKRYQEVRHEG
jgi:hypothetical protein